MPSNEVIQLRDHLTRTNVALAEVCKYLDEQDDRIEAAEKAIETLDARQVKLAKQVGFVLKTLQQIADDITALKQMKQDEDEGEWWKRGGSPDA